MAITPRDGLRHSRSHRIAQATNEAHERLDGMVIGYDPFATRDRFARLVVAQYLFQYDLEPVYRDPELAAVFGDLGRLSRLEQTRLDLLDLGLVAPEPEAPATADADRATRIGWLFVSEGSKLGAASLSKRAATLGLDGDFGARHLAAGPEGRGRGWKDFTARLDALDLGPDDEARAENGAAAAFDRFRVLAMEQFADAPV